MQVLTGKAIKYTKNPKIAAQQLENITGGLKMVRNSMYRAQWARIILIRYANRSPMKASSSSTSAPRTSMQETPRSVRLFVLSYCDANL